MQSFMYNIVMDNFENKSNPFNSQTSGFDMTDWNDFDIKPPNTEHRLNDYDNNLFSENAYKKVDDETFQLEYKINRIENKLKSINLQLVSAKSMNDFQQIDVLNIKKHQYENELQKLHEMYRNQSLPTKLSGEIVNFLTVKPKIPEGALKNVIDFLNQNLFARISDKFNSNLHIKEALVKLENINRNVDDLVSMQTPYGETPEKYDQLLQYLNKANVIQYQISQMVNSKGKK